MYYPYFRGKQFDLLVVKECAEIFAEKNFSPIIEPVKESFNGLKRALAALEEAGASSILIANPRHGDHNENADLILDFVRNELQGNDLVSVGVFLSEETSIKEVQRLVAQYQDRKVFFIHAGFTNPKALVSELSECKNLEGHVFLEQYCGKLYQKNFKGGARILIRDGFRRLPNRSYPDVEPFSDLHATYDDEGMVGFGDFLIVGDNYSESGGPAYAVAIHVTFIDEEMDEQMFVYHFKSDTQDTPTDPAGKFYEALTKLINEYEKEGSKIARTTSMDEFKELFERRHFPGLGYSKKISMKHHIETLSFYFDE